MENGSLVIIANHVEFLVRLAMQEWFLKPKLHVSRNQMRITISKCYDQPVLDADFSPTSPVIYGPLIIDMGPYSKSDPRHSGI